MDQVSSAAHSGRQGDTGRLETTEIYATAENVSSEEKDLDSLERWVASGFFRIHEPKEGNLSCGYAV